MENNYKQKLSQIAIRILSVYTYWNNITRHIPKMRRYSLGVKIDADFSDLIELVSAAQFSTGRIRTESLTKAITKNDVLKFLLYALHELQGVEINHFLTLSTQLEEIGSMLYGWQQQSIKQAEKTA